MLTLTITCLVLESCHKLGAQTLNIGNFCKIFKIIFSPELIKNVKYLVHRCAPCSTIPYLATELQCCLKIDWLQLPQYQTDSAFGANNIEMLAQCSWDVKYLQTLICNNKSSQWCRNQMIFIFSQHYKVIFRYRKSSVRHVGPRNNKLLDCIGN